MTERAACVAIGCKNTSAKWAGHRYICSTHWRMVPRRLKRRRNRLWRIGRKRGWVEDLPGRMQGWREDAPRRPIRLDRRIWFAMERAAIEASVGI